MLVIPNDSRERVLRQWRGADDLAAGFRLRCQGGVALAIGPVGLDILPDRFGITGMAEVEDVDDET